MIWIGGMAFVIFVYGPSIRKQKIAINHPLVLTSFRRLRILSWGALIVILITGFSLLFYHLIAGEYINWRIFGIKMIFVAIIFILTIIHDYLGHISVQYVAASNREETNESFRPKDRLIGRIKFVLGIIVVFLALFLASHVSPE